MIIFTGGEALLRRDLEECGRELYRRGYPRGLVSNGMALSRSRLESLLAAGLHSITISFDGFSEAHNWLRNNPRSYTKALNAIRMLTAETSIAWDVVTCVNKRNIDDLEALREFLFETGVKDWRIFTIFPVGRAAQHPELQLSNEEFTRVLNFIRDTRRQNRIRLSYGCEGNGMHLHDDQGQLLVCHYKRIC